MNTCTITLNISYQPAECTPRDDDFSMQALESAFSDTMKDLISYTLDNWSDESNLVSYNHDGNDYTFFPEDMSVSFDADGVQTVGDEDGILKPIKFISKPIQIKMLSEGVDPLSTDLPVTVVSTASGEKTKICNYADVKKVVNLMAEKIMELDAKLVNSEEERQTEEVHVDFLKRTLEKRKAQLKAAWDENKQWAAKHPDETL